MRKFTRWVLIGMLFLLLIAIRGYIAPYFYDPLNEYFKNDYLHKPIPSIEFNSYFFHLLLRYLLNSTTSLAIIYLVFKNNRILVFSLKFFTYAFFILAVFLFILLKFNFIDGYILIFYVRRFLIQPLFVFVLLPAFYFQKLQLKSK